MKIMTLMDNIAGEHKCMKAEHGLSFYVETDQARILFDFGAGIHAFENAQKLNVQLPRIDFAVGSHGHYDHAGGYPTFAAHGLTCPLVTGEGFFEDKYALNGRKATYLGTGFGKDFLDENQIRYIQCGGALSLAEGCWVIGGFKRTWEFETIPRRFVIRREQGWVPDLFEDEICLALEDKGELVVILGCSHPGILNMLSRVKEHFSLPIKAVVGGTHLVEANRERTLKTIREMKTMGIGLLGFNHCSGELLREMMKAEQSLSTVYLGAGDCLFL